MALHPKYVEELLEEQKHVLAEDNTDTLHLKAEEEFDTELASTAVKKMVKLDAFMREVFRMRGDVPNLPHVSVQNKDYTMSNGYVVPAG
ncbi:hypothetical protein BZG36_05326, partial [Bifiguratus adelaidae]